MSDLPIKGYWMGKDIDDLPREKLVEIIHYMSRQLDAARETTNSIIRVHESARRARSALER